MNESGDRPAVLPFYLSSSIGIFKSCVLPVLLCLPVLCLAASFSLAGKLLILRASNKIEPYGTGNRQGDRARFSWGPHGAWILPEMPKEIHGTSMEVFARDRFVAGPPTT